VTRRAFTLVEVSLGVLLLALVATVAWNLLGSGMRQSHMNIGRTEALVHAMLFLDTLEEDLRHLCLKEKGDRTFFRDYVPGPGTRELSFQVARAPGGGGGGGAGGASLDRPLVDLSPVTYRQVPTDGGYSLLFHNGTRMPGVRVKRLVFHPRKVPAPAPDDRARFFLQTFVTTVDTSGRHSLTLMGLTQVALVSADQRYPRWNPNADRVPYRRVTGAAPEAPPRPPGAPGEH
jgi:hypothetical protein